MKLIYIIASLAFSIIINATTVASTPKEIFLNNVGDIEDGQSRLSKILSCPCTLILEENKSRSLEFKSRYADNNTYFDYIFGGQSQPDEDKSQGIDTGCEDMEVDHLAEKYSNFFPFENEFTNTVRRGKPIEIDDNETQRMNKPITAGDKPILFDVFGKMLRHKWVMSTNDDIYIRSSVDDSLINSICVTPNLDGGPCVLTMNTDFEHDSYYFKFYNIMSVKVLLNFNRDIEFRLQDICPYNGLL